MALEDARVPLPQLYQDYQVRCRMRGVAANETLDGFRRQFAIARAGLDPDEDWDDVLALGETLPEDMLAPFLGVARAARAEDEGRGRGRRVVGRRDGRERVAEDAAEEAALLHSRLRRRRAPAPPAPASAATPSG
jgi:hypothetical protein